MGWVVACMVGWEVQGWGRTRDLLVMLTWASGGSRWEDSGREGQKVI